MGHQLFDPPSISVDLGLAGPISEKVILKHEAPELGHLRNRNVIFDPCTIDNGVVVG